MIRILCSRAGISVLVVAAFACKSTTTPPSPVPTSIAVSAATVTFDALGATQTLTAMVKDQNGAAMSGQAVTWNSGDASIASVSSGTITAVGNGTTTVTATSGSLTADVSVTVEQVATQIVKISGDAQTGVVGDTLADSIVVEQRDSRGHPVPGGVGSKVANSVINFTVATGGGSVATAMVTPSADGRGATQWVLGTAAGEQTMTATTAVATVTALTFTATAAVGAADTLAMVSGNNQTGAVGTVLTDSLVVRVSDQYGNPVAGSTVTFSTSDGGSMSPALTVSGVDGHAATQWTLGPSAAPQSARADAEPAIAGSPVTFDATAVAPDSMAVVKGDNQTGLINTALPDSVVVEVLDNQNNPFPGHPVAFEVATGGGSVSDDTVMTDADGHAGVIWTLGSTAGPQTLTVTGVGVPKGSPRTFTATGASQVATTLLKVAGDNLIGLVGKPTNIPPRVQLLDQDDVPMAGVSITFNVTSGGGSVEGGATKTVATDASGFAEVADWTLGGSSGSNTLDASTAGLATESFTATGQTAAFDIVVRYYGDTTLLTAGAKAAFAAAKARWETLIFGDLQDTPVSRAAGAIPCDTTLPAIDETVDDVLIYAKVEPIDGVNGILGAAGPCLIRSSGPQQALPVVGRMRFDVADIAALESNGSLNLVIEHEMGHVLGFATLWHALQFDLLADSGTADPYFTGAQANAAFDRVGGTAYVAGPKVPVENTGGEGTRDAHWRESVFGNELMTGILNAGANPLSIVSLGSLWDLNYLVNYADADAYAWPTPPPAAVAGGWTLELKNDIDRAPILMVDRTGAIVGVIRP
jgi:hypothetical protein